MVLTAFFTVEGVFQIVTSVAYHNAMRRAWGWMLVLRDQMSIARCRSLLRNA